MAEKEPEAERIEPLPDRAELEKQLKKGLDPNLDYFDATNALKAIGNELRRQAEVQRVLAEHQVTLGNAVIAINDKMIECARDMQDGGVREAAELFRLTNGSGGRGPFVPQQAPMLLPGRHPLSKGN